MSSRPGDADREEQDERQEVFGEPLHGRRAVIAHAAAHRQHHAGDDEERRPHQAVKDEERDERMDPERARREAEDVRAVRLEVAGQRLEVNPAEDERERDGEGEDAAPHDEPVRDAARRAALEDEAVQREVADDAREPVGDVAAEVFGLKKTCQPRLQYLRVGGRWSHIA